MRKLKVLISAVLVCAICFSLCACGLSEKDAVGTWSGTYVYNGNQFVCAFVLSADGTYSEVTYKNGSLSSAETGTYEVKGGKVFLYEKGGLGSYTEYKYKDGKLVNNGHEFTKE